MPNDEPRVYDKEVMKQQIKDLGEELYAWSKKQNNVNETAVMTRLLSAQLAIEHEDFAQFEKDYQELQRMKSQMIIWATPKLRLPYAIRFAYSAIDHIESQKAALNEKGKAAADKEIADLRAYLKEMEKIVNSLTETTPDAEYLLLATQVQIKSQPVLDFVKLLSKRI
ncbi:MAG: hypothetical protein IJX87_00680 [Clostridia bacterium]|nr:hypothetical protein [Clostridia bacterium]